MPAAARRLCWQWGCAPGPPPPPSPPPTIDSRSWGELQGSSPAPPAPPKGAQSPGEPQLRGPVLAACTQAGLADGSGALHFPRVAQQARRVRPEDATQSHLVARPCQGLPRLRRASRLRPMITRSCRRFALASACAFSAYAGTAAHFTTPNEQTGLSIKPAHSLTRLTRTGLPAAAPTHNVEVAAPTRTGGRAARGVGDAGRAARQDPL